MRRKEERSKQGQTNNKAKQHSTPKAVTFLRKMSCLIYIHVDAFIQSCHQLIYTNIMHVHVQLILNVRIPVTSVRTGMVTMSCIMIKSMNHNSLSCEHLDV